MDSYDAIVIGSGQAGAVLALRLVQSGMRVALVERAAVGGSGLQPGSRPMRALAASARAVHQARHAADFGLTLAGAVGVDLAAVMARVARRAQQAAHDLTRTLRGTDGLDLVAGSARFVGRHELAVARRRLTAPRVFVNVGGRAQRPDWPGLDQVPVLGTAGLLALDRLPRHLLVAGGSHAGLELAQVFRRFGAEVTVLETAERLLAHEDPEVSAAVQALLAREGVRIVTGLRRPRVQVRGARVQVRVQVQVQVGGEAVGREHTFTGSHLLWAAGRRPDTDDLGLEHAGLAPDAQGAIPVDRQLRTSVPGIWALGEVNGRGGQAHSAGHDVEVLAANLLRGGHRSVEERVPAYALCLDPPLGRVGLNEAQVQERGRPALVGRLTMDPARGRDETPGLMKVLVDAQTERILGASLLCAGGDEVVHALLDAMAAGVSYRVLQRATPIHATASARIPRLLGQLVPLVPRAAAVTP